MNGMTEKRLRSVLGHTFKNDLIIKCLPLATGFLLLSQTTFSQEYNYRFKLEGITNPADAKMITDVLRPVFNSPETPFAVFPQFYDVSDVFFFRSDVKVTREQLDEALSGNGITTTEFTVTNGSMTGTSNTEKQ